MLVTRYRRMHAHASDQSPLKGSKEMESSKRKKRKQNTKEKNKRKMRDDTKCKKLIITENTPMLILRIA